MESKPLSANEAAEQVELLRQIAASSEVRTRAARIAAAAVGLIAIAVIIACMVLIPRSIAALDSIEQTATELNEVVSTLEQVDFVGMSQSINELTEQGKNAIASALTSVEGALEDMQSALDTVSQFDVDGLNASIADFSALVSPLAKLFGR